MNLDMTVHVWQEGKQYVAHAMPLDVMSSGPSPAAARRAVDEAVQVFLQTAIDLGTLEDVLEESGYEWKEGRWICPAFVSIEKHELALAV